MRNSLRPNIKSQGMEVAYKPDYTIDSEEREPQIFGRHVDTRYTTTIPAALCV